MPKNQNDSIADVSNGLNNIDLQQDVVEPCRSDYYKKYRYVKRKAKSWKIIFRLWVL